MDCVVENRQISPNRVIKVKLDQLIWSAYINVW